MRIGVMLRSIDEKQGIGVYSRNLMSEVLRQDPANDYVLFYSNPASLGTHASAPNATERLVQAPNKAVWDQLKIPLALRKDPVDVLFHTKFTVPFLARCPTVMTIHGASWFVRPDLYPNKLDLAYIKTIMPWYCRKATAILSNSELTTNDFIRILNVPPEKITTTRLGTNESFRVIEDEATLRAAREKYGLPDKFILSVVKYDPRKNFENLIAAFRLLRQRLPCKLVVVGIGCEKYRSEFDLDSDGTSDDVTFLGWVEPEELPVLYNLAHLKFFPSVYEEFGIPTCEAMACGCPPVVSNTGALPEIAGESGILVDPFDPPGMADALQRLWSDGELREDLSKKAVERARLFTWERCAQETISVLHQVAARATASG